MWHGGDRRGRSTIRICSTTVSPPTLGSRYPSTRLLREFRIADRWFLLRCQGWLLVTAVNFVGPPVAQGGAVSAAVAERFDAGDDAAFRAVSWHRRCGKRVRSSARRKTIRPSRFPSRHRSDPSRNASQGRPPRMRKCVAAEVDSALVCAHTLGQLATPAEPLRGRDHEHAESRRA